MDKSLAILLLKPAGLPYVKNIRRKLDHDPEYLKSQSVFIRRKIGELLSNEGVLWDDQVIDHEW